MLVVVTDEEINDIAWEGEKVREQKGREIEVYLVYFSDFYFGTEKNIFNRKWKCFMIVIFEKRSRFELNTRIQYSRHRTRWKERERERERQVTSVME